MEPKKTIIIKNPQLRKIRNNLRLLFIKAASDRKSQLRDEFRRVWWDEDGNPKEYNNGRIRISHDIRGEMEKIDKILDRSICFCPSCRSSDKDMVRNPVTKVWFCIQCYQNNHEFYKHKEKYAHLFP